MFSFRFDQPVLVLPDGLEYNEYNDIFRIPNKEVSQEYVNALSTMNWHGVTASDIQKIANVRTSLMEVEVLGTVFDLKCYEHLDYAELVLVSGSVKATCAGQLPVTLCPDERLVAYRNSKKIDYQAVDANNYNKWMFETQKLDEMRLDAVFVNLEHRYNVEFDIADDVGLEARLTLSLRSEPLEEILDAIALVVPIRYESSGGTIFITRR